MSTPEGQTRAEERTPFGVLSSVGGNIGMGIRENRIRGSLRGLALVVVDRVVRQLGAVRQLAVLEHLGVEDILHTDAFPAAVLILAPNLEVEDQAHDDPDAQDDPGGMERKPGMPGMKVMMRKTEATQMSRALMAVCFLSP